MTTHRTFFYFYFSKREQTLETFHIMQILVGKALDNLNKEPDLEEVFRYLNLNLKHTHTYKRHKQNLGTRLDYLIQKAQRAIKIKTHINGCNSYKLGQ